MNDGLLMSLGNIIHSFFLLSSNYRNSNEKKSNNTTIVHVDDDEDGAVDTNDCVIFIPL